MTIPAKTTTARRILDQLYKYTMTFNEIASTLNDVSKPTLRKVLKSEIAAGHIDGDEPYSLTPKAQLAFIAETQVQYANNFKPLSPKNIPSQLGMREGSNDMRQYGSKY